MRFLETETGVDAASGRSDEETAAPPLGDAIAFAVAATNGERRQVDDKTIESARQTTPVGLQDGLLESPDREENFVLHDWIGLGAYKRRLFGREETFGDLEGVSRRQKGFDVDANLSARRNRHGGHAARMREADVEAGERRAQKGLAVRRRVKTPFGGRNIFRTPGKTRAQQRMRGDIGAAVVIESETLRPRRFALIEKLKELRPFVNGDRRNFDERDIDGGRLESSAGRRQETPSFF